MLTPKTKKILAIVYAIILVGGGLYVRSVILEDNLEVDEKERQGKTVEIKPVKVQLVVKDGKNTQDYSARLENIDTVLDLLERVRDDQSLTFEKVMYSYGVEIDRVNGLTAPEGYIWKVFNNGEEITFRIQDVKLQDDFVYELVLSQE